MHIKRTAKFIALVIIRLVQQYTVASKAINTGTISRIYVLRRKIWNCHFDKNFSIGREKRWSMVLIVTNNVFLGRRVDQVRIVNPSPKPPFIFVHALNSPLKQQQSFQHRTVTYLWATLKADISLKQPICSSIPYANKSILPPGGCFLHSTQPSRLLNAW